MAFTTIDKPSDYFNTVIYTGDGGSSRGVTGVGFQPDWVWIKNRDQSNSHHIYDVIRGTTKRLRSDGSNDEDTVSNGLTAFGSDGFTVGNSGAVNGSLEKLVSWNWKAGTSFTNDASATGIGTIDSTGSVNQDAGFSICSYTGTGSAGTIKHGLNSTPNWILLKNRIDNTLYWYNYLTVLGNNTELYLNATDAAPGSTGAWNTTSPTSSVFSVGSHGGTNASGQATIAYCFAEKQGYSKFGSFVGSSSQQFIYLGFKPRWFLWKNTSQGRSTYDHWGMVDTLRQPYNGDTNGYMRANQNLAESSFSGNGLFFLSNGIQFNNVGLYNNNSGDTYIYMAFAESPFVTSTGVPATAR